MIFISTEYVSLPLATATTAASEDSLTSTESVRRFLNVNGDGVLTKKPLKPPLSSSSSSSMVLKPAGEIGEDQRLVVVVDS